MREAIERLLEELDDDIKGARALYKATKDDWYKGAVVGMEDAVKRLKEVLANEKP